MLLKGGKIHSDKGDRWSAKQELLIWTDNLTLSTNLTSYDKYRIWKVTASYRTYHTGKGSVKYGMEREVIHPTLDEIWHTVRSSEAKLFKSLHFSQEKQQPI